MSYVPSATGSRSLTYDSQLIEDFLHTDDILVDGSGTVPLAVFKNLQGKDETLVVSKNAQGSDEVYHVYREPLSDSGWNFYGLGACPLGVAVADADKCWVLGTDQQVWQNQAGRWSQRIPLLPGGAVPMPSNFTERPDYAPISIGNDGTLWIIDSNGKLYEYSTTLNSGEGGWQPVACPFPLATAPVGNAITMWAISGTFDTGFQVVQFSQGAWQSMPSPGYEPQQLCVGMDNSVWALGMQGHLYQFTDQQWQAVAGAPILYMIAVVDASNLWGIIKTGASSIVQYDGTTWQPAVGAPSINVFDNCFIPLISAGSDGTIWCVDASGFPWKCMSQRGPTWQRQMMPTGMSGITATDGVTEVAVGVDRNGPQAFYIQGGELYLANSTPGGSFTGRGKLSTGPRCTVGITHQQDTGETIVYCVSAVSDQGNLVLFMETANYNETIINAYGTLAGATLQLSAMTADAWFTAAVMDGQLYVQWGNATNPLANGPMPGMMIAVTETPNGGVVPANLKEIIPLPWFQTSVGFYCGVLDSSGNIFAVFNLSYAELSSDDTVGYGSFIPLTGNGALTPSPLAAVNCASALVDTHGFVRIYATDANNQLWVIRQTGLTGDPTNDNPWTWTYWHPLGNNCLCLANGPGTDATRELFTLDGDSFLNHLAQDPVSLNWTSLQIRKPNGTKDDPYYVTQYTTEVTVYDQGNNPEPNVTLVVSVTEPVSVWVSGVQYDLDGATSQTFTTNAMGKLTLSTLALGLHTAQLCFQADGFAAPYLVYPPQNAQDRLQNVTGTTLQNAQSRTQSVPTEVKVPLVAPAQQGNCDAVATVIQSVTQMKTSCKIDPGAPTGVMPNGATPTYQEIRALWKAKVLSVRTVRPVGTAAAVELGSWESFWDDLKDFGEDMWHGIQSGILVVENIVVDVGGITLTVFLKDIGQALIDFVITTIDDVVHAVAASFRWLGAKIEQAIDWLKEFFSWGDILNTKTVLEYYVNQVLSNLTNNLNPNSPNSVLPLVQAQFQNLIDLVSGNSTNPDAFSQARTSFGTTTFNGTVANTPIDPKVGSQGLHPKGVQAVHQAHQVKSNYAKTKSESYINQGGKVVHSGSGSQALDTGGFSALLDLIEKQFDYTNSQSPFSSKCQTLQSNLAGMQNAHGLFDTAINDFLDLLKDFVLFVIELLDEIVLALLELGGQSIATFQEILDYELHIPVLSWLYEKITNHPLTLLDLSCLVFAIPATLVYKLIWGGAPFTTVQVQTMTGTPLAWPQIQGTNVGVSLVPRFGPGFDESDKVAIVLGIVALIDSLGYGLVDLGTDIDTLGGGEVDISKWLSGISILLSIVSLAISTPCNLFHIPGSEWTKADILCVTLWGLGILSMLTNCVWCGIGKKLEAKYDPMVGPIIVAILGALQLGVGIAAAVEYSKDENDYNAFCSAGAIITPIPSIAKLLLIPKSPELMLILGPLDLICDFGSGLCDFGSGIGAGNEVE
jgi:hypothetical protein